MFRTPESHRSIGLASRETRGGVDSGSSDIQLNRLVQYPVWAAFTGPSVWSRLGATLGGWTAHGVVPADARQRPRVWRSSV
jgi:hypothetical protein